MMFVGAWSEGRVRPGLNDNLLNNGFVVTNECERRFDRSSLFYRVGSRIRIGLSYERMVKIGEKIEKRTSSRIDWMNNDTTRSKRRSVFVCQGISLFQIFLL